MPYKRYFHGIRRTMRIDKYLWCVRLFKTRSLASEACSKGRIKINGDEIKPSREVRPGDRIEVRINPIWKSYEVVGVPKSRVGARLVPDFINDTTSEEALEELAFVSKMNASGRQGGTYGRPTKKNRRNLDRFKGD